MSINWKESSYNFEAEEGSDISFLLEVDENSPAETKMKIISGDLKDNFSIEKEWNRKFKFSSQLPIIDKETIYYLTVRAFTDNEYSDKAIQIRSKNKVMDFASKDDNLTIVESSYTTYQFELVNANGNEKFVKIKGELPEGISFNTNGLLYGIVNTLSYKDEYEFTIGIVVDNEVVKQKEITLKVIPLTEIKEPVWITEEGLLGSLNYKNNSALVVKAYDPNDLPLVYKMGDKGSLPTGLSLNADNGRIEGRLLSEFTQEWEFTIIVSNGNFESERMFRISTNVILDEDDVSWDGDDNLGSYKIGDEVTLQLQTKSKHKVDYTLVSNTLPQGLTLNSDGKIIGKLTYQEIKDYKFVVEANNGYKNIQREFTIIVKKGLGFNALKGYLFINHELDNEYNKLVGVFDRNTAYGTSNSLFKINTYPEIDVCTLTCFDKTLLQHLLYFNTDIEMMCKKTVKKSYIQNEKELYDAYYKDLKEANSSNEYIQIQGNKIYIVADETSPSGYINEYTKEPVIVNNTIITEVGKGEGQKYIIYDGKKVYFEVLTSNQFYEVSTHQVVSDDENVYTEEYLMNNIKYKRQYILKNDNKIEVVNAKNNMLRNITTNECLMITLDEVEVLSEPNYDRKYFINDNTTSLTLASTNGIRRLLNQKIYVSKNEHNKVYYDTGSQEIVAVDEEYPQYIIDWDDRRQTYFASYNGERKYLNVYTKNEDTGDYEQVYATYENEDYKDALYDGGYASTQSFSDIINGGYASTIDYKEIIDANMEKYILKPVKVYEEFLNTDVDYKQYFVYDKEFQTLQENIIFTLAWRNDCHFLIKNGQVYHIDKISKPWVYEPELNDSVGFDKTIVLPYITDDDVIDNSYIIFFDKDNEILPQWKTKEMASWSPYTSYILGDMVEYNNSYYRVSKNHVSLDTFTAENFIQMTESEISNYFRPYYYPTLDLFYAKPNTNLVTLSQLNSDEEKGGYLYDRKMIFVEMAFAPLYNSNIDNFVIDFYNHKDNRVPEYQLM